MFDSFSDSLIEDLTPIINKRIKKFFKEKEKEWYKDHPGAKPAKKYGDGITRDCSPITKTIYDVVCVEYKRFKARNEGKKRVDKQTEAEFVALLNEYLGLRKSRTYYSRIWHGEMDQATLDPGEPIFKRKDW